ncbi:hypothetical protein B1790_03330 [Mycobacterium sp. AT1]|nr:hypothetical protein B1790_03330 [Mycobacterium sp. AT1]
MAAVARDFRAGTPRLPQCIIKFSWSIEAVERGLRKSNGEAASGVSLIALGFIVAALGAVGAVVGFLVIRWGRDVVQNCAPFGLGLFVLLTFIGRQHGLLRFR